VTAEIGRNWEKQSENPGCDSNKRTSACSAEFPIQTPTVVSIAAPPRCAYRQPPPPAAEHHWVSAQEDNKDRAHGRALAVARGRIGIAAGTTKHGIGQLYRMSTSRAGVLDMQHTHPLSASVGRALLPPVGQREHHSIGCATTTETTAD
jgi:hypothetical protein